MKCSVRFKALAGSVSFVVIFVLLLVLEDKCETYGPASYVQASIPWFKAKDNYKSSVLDETKDDKIIVVPSLEREDVSWVVNELPEWQHAIYTVDPSSDKVRANTLTMPVNKGHEAMAYLTYIIDNYEGSVPSVVAFLHSHRQGFFKAWHVDTPLHDNIYAMRHLQLAYVREQGYVNLRCNPNPGCKKTNKPSRHITAEVWDEIFWDTTTPAFSQNSSGPAAVEDFSRLEEEEKLSIMQPRVYAACCAQFAVSREQIYKRPLNDYVKIRQWVMNTEKDDAKSGRVMEYLWHVIFGKEAIHCPDPDTCYCKVYGRC